MAKLENEFYKVKKKAEHGWNLMFMGLKELVETGKVSYTG